MKIHEDYRECDQYFVAPGIDVTVLVALTVHRKAGYGGPADKIRVSDVREAIVWLERWIENFSQDPGVDPQHLR